MPPNFDPASPRSVHLPPCKACGIAPELIDLVKAALAANRQSARPTASSSNSNDESSRAATNSGYKTTCPRCTFDNDAALRECEVCGAPLISVVDPRLDLAQGNVRTPSPGPMLSALSLNEDITSSLKISFRAGGDKVFYERLKTALVQRKWLLQGAPPVPKPSESTNGSNIEGSRSSGRKLVGIAGLEMRGQAQRKNNEQIIGNAFEDLEALMTSAKEIIALAESFSGQAREGNGITAEADSVISQSASALGLATTKDMLGSDTLYISELSRNLAEFLLDDSKGILRKEGGIMSLVDVWAVFNRVRNGVELVSPADFEKAAQLWEKLKLPIRLRRFKSGLLVVQGTDRTDERTIASLISWLKELHNEPPPDDVGWDWQRYGRGVTIQEAATKFGWSMGVATEELEMAEERGVLCRDQGLDGVRFWENWLTQLAPEPSNVRDV
jgi:ESCRT-II complex subunit VPS36